MMQSDELFIDEEHELSEDVQRDVAARARQVAAWTQQRVHEHPFVAVGVALATGFVLGRLLAR